MNRLPVLLLRRRDRGSAAISAAMLSVAIFSVIGLGVVAARVGLADGAADSAARAAARAATLARDADTAQREATAAARNSLAGEGITCTATSVTIDTTGFDAELGEAATVTAHLVCTAPLSDIAFTGVPGSKDLTATYTSSIDSYRTRS